MKRDDVDAAFQTAAAGVNVVKHNDPARLAAEEVCAMFGPPWVKYTDAGLPVGRVADIIRKHYAEQEAEIKRLRAVVDAADRMRKYLMCFLHEISITAGDNPGCHCYECKVASAFGAARKEMA